MDGMLNLWVIAFGWATSLPALLYSIRKVRLLEESRLMLMPILGAMVFAAQMVNWAVPGGSTAHLVGAALLTIVLGLPGGIISMATILIVQAFIFGDGGILALGANILNMGVVACLTAHISYKYVSKVSRRAASLISAWLSVVAAALAAGIELGLSTPVFGFGLEIAVPVMVGWHAVLGVPEAIVTFAAVEWLRGGGHVG